MSHEPLNDPAPVPYVLGFLFSDDGTHVVLIRKNKPQWQAGLLNGVGGKVEVGETPHDAMIREFGEETGVVTRAWIPFCKMSGDWFSVDCFKAFDTEALVKAKTKTSEKVEVLPCGELGERDCVSNLHWLIGLARDDNYGKPFYATVKYFA